MPRVPAPCPLIRRGPVPRSLGPRAVLRRALLPAFRPVHACLRYRPRCTDFPPVQKRYISIFALANQLLTPALSPSNPSPGPTHPDTTPCHAHTSPSPPPTTRARCRAGGAWGAARCGGIGGRGARSAVGERYGGI